MAKRTDISKILIIGAGPIVIGQACEFDYSGTQACKALREVGYEVVLINSNPATIMTDPGIADKTYIEPITPEIVERIIQKEKPDALLPTMGGQTSLTISMELFDQGILDKYNVKMIGAKRDVIAKAEDRLLFREAMEKIGLEVPTSILVTPQTDLDNVVEKIGFPMILRPSFTLGGKGGGIAYSREEFLEKIKVGLIESPVQSVLVEESIIGWKEYEMEVVRDRANNCIIICSIENIDPMGVHTGDSMTVAPALTLTDKEYQLMRNASIDVLREIGVETGGSNVQFAIHPDTGRMVVIEMNPRVSRSSALASKATGFPIAKVAAKLAVGFTLDELKNEITQITPASFEPTIDYIVTKIPRFAFEKFPQTDDTLSTSMKAVGEALSMGRTFLESFQKAIRSLERGYDGLYDAEISKLDKNEILKRLSETKEERVFVIMEALRKGFSIDKIYEKTFFDRWYLWQFSELLTMENFIKENGIPQNYRDWLKVKQLGISDEAVSRLTGENIEHVRSSREQARCFPIFNRVDTCSAEFSSQTPYLYSCYEQPSSMSLEKILVKKEEKKEGNKRIVIIGSGPNRIGQGIEFDYCCVHATQAFQDEGYETVMINCNPETVSTDFDTSDRLYLEPLQEEDILEILRYENLQSDIAGVAIQFGGQTPINLASFIEEKGFKLLGTSLDSIDCAEDRDRFNSLMVKLNLNQPACGMAYSNEQAVQIADDIGYPVVVRPSYVLGGRQMEILENQNDLVTYLNKEVLFSDNKPLLIDHYLKDAIEVDVDALSDGQSVYIAGVLEHVEPAGIHSGDSAGFFPPQTLSDEIIVELEQQTKQITSELKIKGFINIQFAVQDEKIYVIEVNPRASRTIPYFAKAIGIPLAKISAKVMLGNKLNEFIADDMNWKKALYNQYRGEVVTVKEAVLPFDRFYDASCHLGPEMRSTGEVMGVDQDAGLAFAKAQLAAGYRIKNHKKIFVSVKEGEIEKIISPLKNLKKMGFLIFSPEWLSKILEKNSVLTQIIDEGNKSSFKDYVLDHGFDLIIYSSDSKNVSGKFLNIREAAEKVSVPYFTTIRGAEIALNALISLQKNEYNIFPLKQDAILSTVINKRKNTNGKNTNDTSRVSAA